MGTVAGTPTTIDVFTRRALSDPPARTGTYVGRGEFYSGIATGDRVFVRDGNIATGRVTVQSMDAGAHLFVDVDDLDDVRPASCLERDRYAVAVLEGVVRRHYPAATAWEHNEAGRVARRLAADVCAPNDLRDRIRAVCAAFAAQAAATRTWADAGAAAADRARAIADRVLTDGHGYIDGWYDDGSPDSGPRGGTVWGVRLGDVHITASDCGPGHDIVLVETRRHCDADPWGHPGFPTVSVILHDADLRARVVDVASWADSHRAPAIDPACDTCGESTVGHAAAEVVRDGRHVLVHANTCLRDGEEVA